MGSMMAAWAGLTPGFKASGSPGAGAENALKSPPGMPSHGHNYTACIPSEQLDGVAPICPSFENGRAGKACRMPMRSGPTAGRMLALQEVTVSSDPRDQNAMSRRAFATRVGGVAAAAFVAGNDFLRPAGVSAAPSVSGRVIGANDKVVVASIGIRGQGNALKRGFARIPNVEIKTLCDIDANLADERINDARLKDVATFKPGFVQDLRRVLDDKDIDGVIIATPNQWHALATIWALQAGKHVYVEKPASYTVWEGRQMVERRQPLQQGRAGRHDEPQPARRAPGHRVHPRRAASARCAWRAACASRCAPASASIPTARSAPARSTASTSRSSTYEPAWDAAYLSKVDYDLWLGPAPARPFNRNRFHYNWHWHWDYGNGDTGNQGPHQFDIARWGLGKNEHPVKVSSMGGYFGPESSQETPDTQTSLFEYADGTVLEFGTRGQFTNDEGTQTIGNLFYGSEGWLWIDGDGRKWQSYRGRKNEPGPGSDAPPESGVAATRTC